MHSSLLRHAEIAYERSRDKDSLEQLQQKKLEQTLENARKTPYYGKLMDELSISSLDDFPLTEKDAVRRDPYAFTVKGAKREAMMRVETSGSTGVPTTIFIDPGTVDYRGSLMAFMRHEMGLLPFDLLAKIDTHTQHQEPYVLSTSGLYRELRLHSATAEAENLRTIKEKRANVLLAYPSITEMLAKLNQESDKPYRFKFIKCAGEMLEPAAKKCIAESFSCPVYDNYNCWEAGPLAWDCPEEKSLHVHSPSCIIEIVDKKGKPKKSGTGEIVLTPLRNNVMSLIRYRVGDLGEWGKECSCGRQLPVLKVIKGRSEDHIVLPSGRIRPAFTMNVGKLEGVLHGTWQHQLVQEERDRIVFRYVPYKLGLDYNAKKEVLKRIESACLGEKVKVEFEEVEAIKRHPGGKLQRIISKVRR